MIRIRTVPVHQRSFTKAEHGAPDFLLIHVHDYHRASQHRDEAVVCEAISIFDIYIQSHAFEYDSLISKMAYSQNVIIAYKGASVPGIASRANVLYRSGF